MTGFITRKNRRVAFYGKFCHDSQEQEGGLL